MKNWIARLFKHPDMLGMGHAQSAEDLNLGLGWVYYALARALRPKTVVVIGSYRGFVPLVLGKALQDNGKGGRVIFIDPSMVDDFWRDRRAVKAHFARFGVTNITHYLMTTQQFVKTPQYKKLRNVGLVFVDGYHSYEQSRFDHEAFASRMDPQGITLFHDSVHLRESRIYGEGKSYMHEVKTYMTELKKDPGLQVLDLPLLDGVTLVRKDSPVPPRGTTPWERARRAKREAAKKAERAAAKKAEREAAKKATPAKKKKAARRATPKTRTTSTRKRTASRKA